jgi:hypothetical protein
LSQKEPHGIPAAIAAEPPQNEIGNAIPQPTPIYSASVEGELRQGEIITDLPELRLNVPQFIATGDALFDIDLHPYAIVVSQDCDLMQDYSAKQDNLVAPDKVLPNILFCEATTAKLLRGRADINKDAWRRAVTNKNERYHVLESVPAQFDTLGVGLPALGVDFKRYFSLPRDEAYHRVSTEASRRCRLLNPYLEHLCTRFFYFQYRVALPVDHRIEL